MAIQVVTEVLSQVQPEILVFAAAACVHSLLFGRFRALPRQKTCTKAGDGKTPELAQKFANLKKQTQTEAPPLPEGLLPGAGQELLEAELQTRLEGRPAAEAPEVLADVLELVGKAATATLLSAVRAALRERGLSPRAPLGQALLRAYLGLKMPAPFSEVLAEVEQAEGGDASPAVALLAMKAALASGDLKAMLHHLPGAAGLWQCGEDMTASAAPRGLLQQLLRLAASQGELPLLMDRLNACGLMKQWVAEAAVAVCVQRGDPAALAAADRLSRTQGVSLPPGAYAQLIKAAASEKEALRCFEEAAHRSLATEDVLLAATLRGQPALARAVVRRLPPRLRPELASVLLQFHSPGGALAGNDPQGSILAFYTERLWGVDLETVTSDLFVVDAALARGREDVLVAIVDAMPDNARRVALVKALGERGLLQGAQHIFRLCPEKTVCLYNALLDACIESNNVRAAEAVMEEAAAAIQPDIITHNTFIKAQLRAGNLAAARVAVQAMQRSGMAPNSVTFNELLDYAVSSRSGTEWSVVDEMQALGLKPNQVTCSILLKSLHAGSKASAVERTLRMVRAMEDTMDEVLMSSVCEACIRAKCREPLVEQLKMHRTTRKVHIRGAHTFGSMIRAYGFVNDMEHVWETWAEMKKRGVVLTNITLGCMVEALAMNNEVEGFSRQRRFERVWAVYQEMLASKMPLTLASYNALVDACACCGEMYRVPGLLDEMVRQRLRPNVITCSTIIKGYCQENSLALLDKAFVLLEDMRTTLHVEPDEVTYNTLLDGCARMCEYERGIQLLSTMQDVGIRPSNYTLSVAVKLAGRCHKVQAAFDLTEAISRKYHLRPNIHVYNNLMNACVAHWDLPRAMQVFEQTLKAGVTPDVRSYTVMLRGCLAEGDGEGCIGLLRLAMGLRGGRPQAGSEAWPTRGLPSQLVVETIEGLGRLPGCHVPAVALLQELRRLPWLRLEGLSGLVGRLAAQSPPDEHPCKQLAGPVRAAGGPQSAGPAGRRT